MQKNEDQESPIQVLVIRGNYLVSKLPYNFIKEMKFNYGWKMERE